MTDPRDDQFWNEMRPEMRRALHLDPLTNEEAARAYDQAPEVPLSEDQIAQFVRIASSAVPREPSYNERINKPSEQLEEEVGEVLGLYRNEGDIDPEVEEEMKRQREEALSDDEEEDEEETDEP